MQINLDFTIVFHYSYWKTTSKIFRLSLQKLQNWNQNKEAREQFGRKNAHKQQCKSIPSSSDSGKHSAHSESFKSFTMGSNVAKTKYEGKRKSMSSSKTKILQRGAKQSFPKHCIICESTWAIKIIYPNTVSTSDYPKNITWCYN